MQRKAFIEQFEIVAARRGAAPAVEEEGRSISYRDLDSRANAVAHALLQLGVEARGRTVVGLFMEPGIDYVAGLLGCAKAGCVFLPLPPDLPEQRLTGQLETAKVGHVVTDRSNEPRLTEQLATLGRSVAIVRSDAPGLGSDQGSPGVPVGPGDPCYVLFTSGSTGAPKAILGQQRSLSHFLRWEIAEFGLDERCRCSWLAPITFDVSLRDILVPLMTGGTLLVPAPETRILAHRLADWLAVSAATLVHIVPTLLRLLTRELEHRATGDAPLPCLRHLLVAGEPLLARDVEAWRAAAGTVAEVVNLYGPSETTLAKLFHRIADLPDLPHQVLPVGRPLPDTVALILNGRRLCRVGEIGDIHIRTPYRSLGYLADPAATAATFIANPLTGDPDDILYRTGDLGRYTPDGLVVCLGRQDNQVKINGVRVELAEIEVAMRAIADIDEVAAVLHRGADESSLLVAYYSRRDRSTDPLEPASIRSALAHGLPLNMQPRAFVVVATMPKTISGKVNRKALPKPDELIHDRSPFVPPRGPTEEAVAGIWRELFGLARVSATVSFRDLGGDSLKAIRAIMSLWQVFQVDVTLKQLFDHSTVRALAAVLGQARAATAIPSLPDAETYPASPGQERLWSLDRMGVAPTAYNLAEAYRLVGPLDVAALERSFLDIIARQEALRTTFREVDGVLRQVVHQADRQTLRWRIGEVDLRRDGDAEGKALALADAERAHHFDLVEGPLLRVSLLRMPKSPDGGDHNILLFNLHHIVADLWSLDVLADELATTYAAHRAGTSPALPPLPRHYRDVVAWQNARLDSAELASARDHWRAQLAQPSPPLELPSDRPRPAVRSFAGATERFRLGPIASEALAAMAQAHDVTEFVVCTALVSTLLARSTGQDDISIGTVVAGREHAAMAPMIGYFANVVVLRQRLDRTASFSALLANVSRCVEDALAHQIYPFDALVREIAIERDISRSPLFDVMIVDHAFDADLRLDGLAVAPFGPENGWAFSRYDLVFHFQRGDDGLVLDLNYNTDLFDGERIRRCGEHLRELARSATLAPTRSLADLDLVSPAEAAILASFEAGPARNRPAGATIPGRVFAAAAAHADRPAAIEAGRTLDYASLANRVDRLARHLIAQPGLERGARVAVLARRSVDSILAMLAIMAAGGVYVPIDPLLPKRRIAAMLRLAGCRLVLADASFDCDDPAATVVDLRALLESLPSNETGEVFDRSAPDDVAYIIFTSGSTGEPRAVMVEHRGVVNMSLGQIERFGIEPRDRIVQFASPSFDASIANMFMALFAGAAVLLPSVETLHDIPAFLDYLGESGASVLTLPPTYLRAIGRAALGAVRTLITAGEPAPVEEVAHYAAGLAVFNAYGPTEASVCASTHAVADCDLRRPRLPIGTPLPNTRVRILDDRLKPVPIGIEGEIFLGGLGVARGYLNDAEATARSFIAHPATSERLYRTGDRGLWLNDGGIDFLGRRDAQVKVSGHRIEPAEVESAMRALPGVRDAHVALHRRDDGSSALVGYYVVRPTPELWPSIAEFFVYDDVTYGRMATDEGRNQRYRAAFARHLRDKVVVDVGTGPQAILARLAVEAGARKVYAIDLLAETATAARRTVAALDLDGRIEVVQGDAASITLPEPVDWCVSEMVGAIGGAEGAVPILNAMRRHLREPANMLPRRSLTAIAAASLPDDALLQGFSDIAAHYVERIFAEAKRPFDLRLCVKNLPDEALISTQGTFEDLDFTRPLALEDTHDVELDILRRGPLTGFVVWLQLAVDDDLVVDILQSRGSWLPIYLPVFATGVTVEKGDRLELTVERTSSNGLNPDFHIVGRVERPGRDDVPVDWTSPHACTGFRTSPFYRRLFVDETVPRRPDLSREAMRRGLSEHLPAYAVPAFLIEVERIPLTVNGKIDSAALPSPRPGRSARRTEPGSDAEAVVLETWRHVLEQDVIGLDDEFFGLGGDSIRAIRVVSELRRRGWRTQVRDLFQNPTPERFALSLVETRIATASGPVVGEVPLSPVQRWLLADGAEPPDYFNQAIVLRSDDPLDARIVAGALAAIWRQHDALRARFTSEHGETRQILAAPDAVDLLETLLLGTLPPAESWQAAATRLHARLRLGVAPLLGGLLGAPADARTLLLVAHHAVIDAVSWRILAEDFAVASQQIRQDASVDLGAGSATIKDYAAALDRIARSTNWDSRCHYWRRVEAPPPLPCDFDAVEAPRFGDAEQRTLSLSEACGQTLLSQSHRVFRVGVEEVLLAALGAAIARVFGPRAILITLEGHGRQAPIDGDPDFPDLGRTIGWFTNFFPFRLAVDGGTDVGAMVRAVASALNAVPDRGRSYGLLTRHPAGPRLTPLAGQVGFNFLGNFGASRIASGLSIDWNAPGQAIGADVVRPHALDLLVMVIGGRMELALDFDRRRYRADTADRLLVEMAMVLGEIADAARADDASVEPAHSASAHISADLLDQLFEADE